MDRDDEATRVRRRNRLTWRESDPSSLVLLRMTARRFHPTFGNHLPTEMAKTDFQSVDDYLAAQPADVRPALERVRGTIRKALPDADEVISYQIPTYRLQGIAALYFAGWKEHYSIYPASALLVSALEDELAPYEINKGTIRFQLAKPVPVRLISRIAKQRAKEVAAKHRTKTAVAKRPRTTKRRAT